MFKQKLYLAAFAAVLMVAPSGAEALAANTHSAAFSYSSSTSMSVGDSASLSITGDITVEAWIKPINCGANGGAKQTIASKGNATNNRSWELGVELVTGKCHINLKVDDDGDNVGPDTSWRYSSTTIANDTWQHVAAVYDDTTKDVTIYIDGEDAGTGSPGSASNATGIYDGDADTYVGRWGVSSGYFSGKIDDVRIWNTARTETQIADDMEEELNGTETGLVAYWKFNDDDDDEASNGNDLTNNNSVTYSTDTPFSGVSSCTATDASEFKTGVETVANTTLQEDDELCLSLSANSTYAIDALLFATTTSATPDLKMAFDKPAGATMLLGYTAYSNGTFAGAGFLTEDEVASGAIPLVASGFNMVKIAGTVVTPTAGNLGLQWAQNTSSSDEVTLVGGSFLRAE